MLDITLPFACFILAETILYKNLKKISQKYGYGKKNKSKMGIILIIVIVVRIPSYYGIYVWETLLGLFSGYAMRKYRENKKLEVRNEQT